MSSSSLGEEIAKAVAPAILDRPVNEVAIALLDYCSVVIQQAAKEGRRAEALRSAAAFFENEAANLEEIAAGAAEFGN